MLNVLKVRLNHGYQAIKNIRKAVIHSAYRGFPLIDAKPCQSECRRCFNECPSDAISKEPLSIDLGKCVFCGKCEKICPERKIQFSNFHKTASTLRDHLFIQEGENEQDYYKDAVQIRKEIKKIFSHSLKLRQVSAGGCNSCEMELNACSNVNFDMGRFGIDFVASPRHADGLVITGPISENMAKPLEDTYLAIGSPKIVILTGSCAISAGVFQNSPALNRSFLDKVKVDLYIPGCPVHPLAFINGILDFIGRK